MFNATDALSELNAGNARFVDTVGSAGTLNTLPDSQAMSGQQKPFAIVLSCSDSRVPVEYIFDQGFGSLFVVRVAGNIAGPTQLGSIEFAVNTFGCSLIVVLGHSNCGAVAATLGSLRNPEQAASEFIESLLEPIRPAIAPVLDESSGMDEGQLMAQAVRANVDYTVGQIKSKIASISQKLESGELMLVGAEYSLETGAINWPT